MLLLLRLYCGYEAGHAGSTNTPQKGMAGTTSHEQHETAEPYVVDLFQNILQNFVSKENLIRQGLQSSFPSFEFCQNEMKYIVSSLTSLNSAVKPPHPEKIPAKECHVQISMLFNSLPTHTFLVRLREAESLGGGDDRSPH